MIVDEIFSRINRGETRRVIYFQQTCGVCPINKRLPSARHSLPMSNLAAARAAPPMQKRKNREEPVSQWFRVIQLLAQFSNKNTSNSLLSNPLCISLCARDEQRIPRENKIGTKICEIILQRRARMKFGLENVPKPCQTLNLHPYSSFTMEK